PLDTLLLVLAEEPVPPSRLSPRLPHDLETICLKCLQKEPKRRYASAADLADDLGRFLRGEPIRARPTPPWARAVEWVRRQPTLAALLLVSGLAAGGLLGGWARFTAKLADERTRARQGEVIAQQERATARKAEGLARRRLAEVTAEKERADREA